MCTAITFSAAGYYFGRNLDHEEGYGECVAFVPRAFPLPYKHEKLQTHHYAMIGMAKICDGYPLFYDGVNEYGLAVAALNFPGNAYYGDVCEDKLNLAPYELIPKILSSAKTTEEAVTLIKNINLVATPYKKDLPLSELHFLIADKNSSVVAEPMEDGIAVWENRIGVLTNNPPFPHHIENLKKYLHLSPKEAKGGLSERLNLSPNSRGTGALGLPGDSTSESRFVRAVFTKLNALTPDTEPGSVNQFFHILSAVEQVEGCVRIGDKAVRTQYSCCMNLDTGVYYYKTYSNSKIYAVSMLLEDADKGEIVNYPLLWEEKIHAENQKIQP